MAQYAAVEALTGPQDDVAKMAGEFDRRRRLIVEGLNALPGVRCPMPRGAFYAFAKVPERLGMTATQFKEAARARRVLVVPGAAFSSRDTHFRLSFATAEAKLREGLDILVELMR